MVRRVAVLGMLVAGCFSLEDSCPAREVAGWVLLDPTGADDAGAPFVLDGRRRAPVVTVDGDDAGVGLDAGDAALPLPNTDAAADASARPADGTLPTCDILCAKRLGSEWVILGCRPPARSRTTGRAYVYCEARADFSCAAANASK